jgi:3-dehydroquinate dehydratase/shikimate dehydrogenase
LARRASLIATLTESPEDVGIDALPAGVEWLELRADLVGDVPAAWLRERFDGGLLYTLRSRAEGGEFAGSNARRRERLTAAAADFDRVDLEVERDLQDALLADVPVAKRVFSWHGAGREIGGLEDLLERMLALPAALYKIVVFPRTCEEEVAPLELLARLRRQDVVAFAAEERGLWTRFLAPYLGAAVMYGAWGRSAGAPGQPSIERICRDFPHPELPEIDRLFGIVGNPVSHSLSPRLHNGAYAALGIPALYLPFGPPAFADFWLEVVEDDLFTAAGFPLQGLSVTAPFKSSAVAVAGAASPLAHAIDSVNTLTLGDGVWEGETTDPNGVVGALDAAGVEVAGSRAAVIGCGGAGRAAAAGLAAKGSRVTLFNRTVETGERVAAALHLDFSPLEDLDPARFDIAVNATSLGHGADDDLAFDPERQESGAAVVDLVYGGEATALLRRAQEHGSVVVDGREVLLFQAVDQFRLMTGREMPIDLGRELLDLPPREAVA